MKLSLALIVILVAVAGQPTASAADLLPDLVVRQNDLYDHQTYVPLLSNRVYLQFSNGTANVGLGKLMLWADRRNVNDTVIAVQQRIFQDDGSYRDRLAGNFIYHPRHDHIHVEGWCSYRLRELLPGDSVGSILVEGPKTSFCVFDDDVYDSTLANYNPDGEFFQCYANVQGLSVGWIDVYTKDLPGQEIEITDIPDGVYWLEAEVDPDDIVEEINETNNIARIKVVIGSPAEINQDAFEPNDSAVLVDWRPVGGPNSPNLGPCNPIRTIENLTIHHGSDTDLFRIYLPAPGTAGTGAGITFDRHQADLDMRLLSSGLQPVAESNGNSDSEYVSFEGVPAGWYYISVYSYLDDICPDYTLSVTPPANQPPQIQVTRPTASDTLLHGLEAYRIEWEYSDPENRSCWVSIFLNTQPTFDGNEQLMPTSLYTDAGAGFYTLNSAYLDFNTYYVYAEITDGGTSTGDWSEGSLTFIEAGDPGTISGRVTTPGDQPVAGAIVRTVVPSAEDTTDTDGTFVLSNLAPTKYDISVSHPDYMDTTIARVAVMSLDTTSLMVTVFRDCGFTAGDVTGDAVVDLSDVTAIVDFLFLWIPLSNPAAGNVNGSADGSIDISDLTYLVNYLYVGGTPPTCAQ